MAVFSLAIVLNALQAVGPIVAAAPQFKALWDQIVNTFDNDNDQETLKNAYEVAISDAGNAHQQLQDIVRRNGG